MIYFFILRHLGLEHTSILLQYFLSDFPFKGLPLHQEEITKPLFHHGSRITDTNGHHHCKGNQHQQPFIFDQHEQFFVGFPLLTRENNIFWYNKHKRFLLFRLRYPPKKDNDEFASIFRFFFVGRYTSFPTTTDTRTDPQHEQAPYNTTAERRYKAIDTID